MEGLEDATEKFCGKRLRTRFPLNCAQQHLRRDHITAMCSRGIFCLSLPFLFFGGGVRMCMCSSDTYRSTHGYTYTHSACIHRHLRLLKAEVKSHIKAESYWSSTVQRHQLPSWERQIVTLIKRF